MTSPPPASAHMIAHVCRFACDKRKLEVFVGIPSNRRQKYQRMLAATDASFAFDHGVESLPWYDETSL